MGLRSTTKCRQRKSLRCRGRKKRKRCLKLALPLSAPGFSRMIGVWRQVRSHQGGAGGEERHSADCARTTNGRRNCAADQGRICGMSRTNRAVWPGLFFSACALLGLRLLPAGFDDVFPPRKCFVIRLYSTRNVFVRPQRISVPVKVNHLNMRNETFDLVADQIYPSVIPVGHE